MSRHTIYINSDKFSGRHKILSDFDEHLLEYIKHAREFADENDIDIPDAVLTAIDLTWVDRGTPLTLINQYGEEYVITKKGG